MLDALGVGAGVSERLEQLLGDAIDVSDGEARRAWLERQRLEQQRNAALVAERKRREDGTRRGQERARLREAFAAREGAAINVAWLPGQHIEWDALLAVGAGLRELRLVGLGLGEVPGEVLAALPQLEVLSLASNRLVSLPGSLGGLAELGELQLGKNQLRSLPRELERLTQLTELDLTGNRLRSLPAGVGALQGLSELKLEGNELETLPDSLAALRGVRLLNLSHNRFLQLPESTETMRGVEVLLVNHNGLAALPVLRGSAGTLRHISAGHNALSVLPDALVELPALRSLWVEYNRISRLPVKFPVMTFIRELRLLGNPLVSPPLALVERQGLAAAREFCALHNLAADNQHQRRVVEDLQALFASVERDGLDVSRALYNPSIVRREKGLPVRYTGFVLEALFSDIVPAVRAQWRDRRLPHSFGHAREDVERALANYSDHSGPVARRELARFRRCACRVRPGGRRRACVATVAGFLCEREAVLLKARLRSAEAERSEQLDVEMAQRLRQAEEMARTAADAYLDTAEGEMRMVEQATAVIEAEETLAADTKQRLADRAARRKVRRRLARRRKKRRNKLRRQRRRRERKLEAQRDALQRRSDAFVGGPHWRLDRINEKLAAAKAALAGRMRWDDELDELGWESSGEDVSSGDEQKQAKAARAALYGSSGESAQEGEDEGEGEEEEEEEEEEEAEEAEGRPEDDTESDEDERVDFALLRRLPAREVTALRVREAQQLARAERQRKERNVPRQVLIARERDRFAQEFVDAQVAAARRQVQREFHVLKKTAAGWTRVLVKRVFEAWRDCVREALAQKAKDRDRDQYEREAEATQAEAARAVGTMAARKWREYVDELSDRHYWQHTETDEIREAPPAYWAEAVQRHAELRDVGSTRIGLALASRSSLRPSGSSPSPPSSPSSSSSSSSSSPSSGPQSRFHGLLSLAELS